MATVNNVIVANVAKGSGAMDLWPHYWAATRAMKKAGWKYLASGDGTSKDTSANAANDLWGAGTSTGNTGAAATFAAATVRGRLLITGLTGMTTASKGRFLVFTGTSGSTNNCTVQIEEYVSATSVYVDARAFTFTLPEANNGAISWTETSPTAQTIPAGLATVAAWWLGRGPSTLKIPITAAPAVGGTGFTFIRGENITQATTGAEGEILGYVFSTVTSTGYLTVLPRVIGTGGGVFGWATGNLITGATSGATVTQNGTALEYRQQVVIAKTATSNTGAIFIQCIEPVGESASSFATLAVAAGCTATVWPGGGGTGNGFPTIAYTGLGAGGATTGARWSGSTSSTGGGPVFANGQIIVADAIWEQNYSPDGTWQVHSGMVYGAAGTSGRFIPGAYNTRGLFRMDDTEPGDLDPFVYFGPTTATLYSGVTGNRSVAADTTNGSDWMPVTATSYQGSLTTSAVHWRGWQRRGLGSEDDYSDMESTAGYLLQSSATFMVHVNPSGGDNVRTEPVTTRVREPVRIVSATTTRKMRKGSVRHLQILGALGGSANTTYDGGRFIQLNDQLGAYVAGPWDQSTVPVTG